MVLEYIFVFPMLVIELVIQYLIICDGCTHRVTITTAGMSGPLMAVLSNQKIPRW